MNARIACLVGLAFAVGCSGSAASSTTANTTANITANTTASPAASGASNLPPTTLYVADRCTGRVDAFFSLANGNVKPAWTIEGSATQLVHPASVAANGDGIWVSNNSGGPGVLRFAADASGNAAATVVSAKPGSAQAVSVDAHGRTIAPGMNGTIATFAADGSAVGAIAGSATTTTFPRAAVTAADGTIYVANSNASILVFGANANGNIAPRAIIAGPATGLKSPSALAFDPNGDLVVTDESGLAVSIFAPGASGNVAPLRRIAGAKTALNVPQGVAVAPDGSIYVANASGKNVLVFAPHADGDAAPRRIIAGDHTGFICPAGVALQ